jgi:hypothetical protein
VGGQWSKPFSHSKKYFDEYYESFDPADLYTSRYIRSFDQLFLQENLSKGEPKQFSGFRKILMQHVPPEADSIHIIVTRKYVVKFSMQVDTVYNAQLNVLAEKI